MTFSLGAKAASAGYRLAAFDQIGSTNAEAMSCARDGVRGPMWFVTTEQTAGRGRRQRAWVAPRGNLASSVLEVMDVSPAVAATMGFAFGLAHEAALRRVSVEANMRLAGSDQLKYLLKWPNDILVRGQKLCGLLLEAEAVERAASPSWPGSAPMWLLRPRARRRRRPRWPRSASMSAPRNCSPRCRTPGSKSAASGTMAEASREIRRLWLECAFGLGERVAIKTGIGAVEGTFDTIDDAGCLIVRTADGKRVPITAGEVYFGTAASAGAA